jgi:CDP-4-dehydro-6-deoxyglucose reductase
MQISVSNLGAGFSATAGQTLLDAALAAGLNLPHSCKSGNCGSCKALLRAGRVDYPNGPPAGLSQGETDEGYVLLCQAHARGDLTIETRQVLLAHEALIKRLPCRIERVEALSHDVMALHLRLPAAEEFRFAAGQYIDVMLAGGRRRSFSIASPPHDARPLELHVRRVAGGEFTGRLFGGLGVGALLQIEGPLGQFVCRDGDAPLLMVAGGTGLAPLHSMIRHLVENGSRRDITLYWGVRSQRDLYAGERLRQLASRAHRMRYVPVLSEPAEPWDGRRGWVHEAVLADLPRLEDFEVYASGPPAMIAALRRDFRERGLPAGRLYFDSFDYAPDSVARQRKSSETSA